MSTGIDLMPDRICSFCGVNESKITGAGFCAKTTEGDGKHYFMIKVNTQVSNWAKIKDSYMISPIYGGNGRVLVQEDPFKSRYECSECGGSGHTDKICPDCDGTKIKEKEGTGTLVKGKMQYEIIKYECTSCKPTGANIINRAYGYVLCPKCDGKQGLIITPEDSQKNATTGNILAISNRDILEVKTGDKVIFTNYSGSPFKIADVELRIIIERDLLGIVKFLKKGVDSMNEGTFADIANAGLVR